jgi:Cysteine-rich CPCC
VFEWVSRVELGDGRALVVEYQGERYGWDCYIPGDAKRPTFAASPAEAIVRHLGYAGGQTPAWVLELSERRQRELREAPRYACPCCGYLTLLNPGRYEICAVCWWEDDPAAERDGADAHSGPNHISLNEGRANFARFGASTERGKQFARAPRPAERPSS